MFAYKNIYKQRSDLFSIGQKYSGIFKHMNKVSQGSNNPEIMECGGFGLSNNKAEAWLDQN